MLKNTRDSSLFQCAFRDRPVGQTVQLKKSWGQEYHMRIFPTEVHVSLGVELSPSGHLHQEVVKVCACSMRRNKFLY